MYIWDCLLPFERQAFAAVLHALFLLALLAFCYGAYVRISVYHRKKWWDQSSRGPFHPLKWCEVKKLMDCDPLSACRGWRLGGFTCWAPTLCILVIGLVLLGAAFWFIRQYVDFVELKELEEIGTWIGGVSVFAGVIGFVVQAKISTRSKNRQEWIDQIRKCLGGLICNLPDTWINAEQPLREHNSESCARRYYLKHHATLELLLNPSEKEHRGLLSLLRYMYGWEEIEIDDEALENLGFTRLVRDDEDDWINLKSKVIRLSNAVLKREWEQIKHIR